MKRSGFACMECGYRFRTIAAAERAAFGECGCPKCGGSDIDIATEPRTEAAAPSTEAKP